MDNNDPYNGLTWDSILEDCKNKKHISLETIEEPKPEPLKSAVSDGMKFLLKIRLQFINLDDTINIYSWCPAEEIVRIWQQCGSPSVKSVSQMTHAEAWTMQQKCWSEEQKYKNPPGGSASDIWLLNDLDKKYFSWCSGLWADLNYSKRLSWLANVRVKRERNITPHLILLDIADPNGNWKTKNQHDEPYDYDEGHLNENNSPFY